jgi:hypothetical protein
MPLELFTDVIEKACGYGFATFGLTPLLGEPLLDPCFPEKLEVLERHPAVRSYSFATNLTVASPSLLSGVSRLHKLRYLSISLYGHDPESFSRVAGAPAQLFFDVLGHLERLSEWPAMAGHVELRIRTTAPFQPERCHPRLRELLGELAGRKVRIRVPEDRYSNWSGLISPGDVADLGIRLKPESPKTTIPCAFLFYKHTVLPDGRLNACYGDDGETTMVIGDLTRQRFEEIYSLRNNRYIALLLSQMKGRWKRSCRACTGYRGVNDHHYSYAFHEKPFLTLSEFMGMLEPPDRPPEEAVC